MRKVLLLSVVFIALLGILSININAQADDLEKKWSRVTLNENTTNVHSDYIWNPAPPVFQKYNFGNTDVLVRPNYRIAPGTNVTQSELSIDIHPLNPNIIFASANATTNPASTLYGTGVYWTLDGGLNWTAYNNPAPLFPQNYGDPASCIGTNGYFYEGYITLAGGMGVATSTNNGVTWTNSVVSSLTSDDKNHLMVDKKVGSPYENRLYNVWTDFNGSTNNNQIVFRYSTNYGTSWSTLLNLSSSLNAGSHNQGCNVQTGPNGEVYVTWAVYDNWVSGGYGEDAIGFAKSTNGGTSFSAARIYGAMTPNGNFNFGIRGNIKPTSIRVSSFPSMAVDRSGGSHNGYIYIVWPQKGVAPAGSDPDIVCIRSTDNGATWSAPVRVNDDALNNGKEQYYPWCTVDQTTGQLNIVFYDNRNTTSDSTGVFMARSNDGGLTFENFQVSDANFRPKSISGLATGYQGDYIGIAASNNKAYPFWMDDRTGNYLAWITEVTFGPAISHTPLTNTENMTGPYVVNATITSTNPLNAGSIKVYWGRGAGVISDSVLMTNTGGDNYTANIPGDGLPHVYNYYIKAYDDQGYEGTAPGGAPLNYYSFTAATDMVAPTITHTAIGNVPQIRWPASVSATVTDNIGVQSVECEFRVNSGAISTFPMPLVSDNNYKGTFTGTVNIGDLVEYRIKATDNSSMHNVAYSPASGFNSFNIIDVKGLVLVVNDDVTLLNRSSQDKGGSGELDIPLGASADLFNSTLTAAGYLVEQVTFNSLNVANLNNYDLVILSAGLNESTMFADATKRAALVNYTLAGKKTIVEGGEVGYIYRKSGTTTDLDPPFRRYLLLDSAWVSDRSSANLVPVVTSHAIFNVPYPISGTITVNNGGSAGYGARDEMTLMPTTGVSRIANWTGGTAANGGIIIYNTNGDTSKCRNIFFTFSISQFADQTLAAHLIENAVEYMFRDIVPVELTSFTANVSGNNVNLNWNTATELNNSGFEVQRKSGNSEFSQIGYVAGFGTTTQPKSYSFTDSKLAAGNYTYRLKQVDFDGSFKYSDAVNVEVVAPVQYSLEQNYPNPFNPSTLIKYSVAKDGFVNISVFNLLGEKVATLVNTNQKAGSYEFNFNASSLSSGVYFYSIEAGDFKVVRKMMLMK